MVPFDQDETNGIHLFNAIEKKVRQLVPQRNLSFECHDLCNLDGEKLMVVLHDHLFHKDRSLKIDLLSFPGPKRAVKISIKLSSLEPVDETIMVEDFLEDFDNDLLYKFIRETNELADFIRSAKIVDDAYFQEPGKRDIGEVEKIKQDLKFLTFAYDCHIQDLQKNVEKLKSPYFGNAISCQLDGANVVRQEALASFTLYQTAVRNRYILLYLPFHKYLIFIGK